LSMGQAAAKQGGEEETAVSATPPSPMPVPAEGIAIPAAANVDLGRSQSTLGTSPLSSSAGAASGLTKRHSGFSLRGSKGSKKEKKKTGSLVMKLRAQSNDSEMMTKTRRNELFDKYRNVTEEADDVDELDLVELDAMGPNGMAVLLRDLGLAEDDIVAFVVAWKLGASRVSRVTRSEFVNGLAALKCDSVAGLRALLPQLEGELKAHHRDVYSYAFKISRGSNAKTLDLASARILIELFLPPDFNVHVAPFVQWLTTQQVSYRALNHDQFINFYDFVKSNIADDLSNFDEDECWPCIIDAYVEYRKAESSCAADGA